MVGNRAMRAKSAVMAAAVSNSSGRCIFFNDEMEVSAAFVVTLTAAMIVPDASLTGAAMERMPNDNRSSDNAQPRVRTSASTASNSLRDGLTRGTTRDCDGIFSTASRSLKESSESRTCPIDVAMAGNRVPICTDIPMILGTGTRAAYTMSLPSSCDIELDSFVLPTRSTRCGRAMSHIPCALMYDKPSSRILGVNVKSPSAERTYPNCSSVMSRRRAVGRARSAAAATSLTDIARCDVEKTRMTLSPLASASTKSPSSRFGDIASRPSFSHTIMPVNPKATKP